MLKICKFSYLFWKCVVVRENRGGVKAMNTIVTQNAQTGGLPARSAAPLVVYSKDLESKPLDGNARVTLTRLAYLADELRRSGLPATLNVTEIVNEASKNGKGFETKGVGADIEIEGVGRFGCRNAFEKDGGYTAFVTSFASLISTGFGAASGFGAAFGMLAAADFSLIASSATLGAGVGLVMPTAGLLAYRAMKTGSLKAAFQAVSDVVRNRKFFHDIKTETLHTITQGLIKQAGDEKCITLTPQQGMTPVLKEIIRYAQTQGVRIDLVLPDSGQALPTMKSSAPTLGEVVAQITPPKPSPAFPRPDAEQERWAGGLAASFNRLSKAVESLDSNDARAAAQRLLDVVKTVQILCAEVRINNTRIGKVGHELDNISDQVEGYGRLKRLGIGTQEDSAALARIFSVKANSIAGRFAGDLEALRGNFEDRQRLLERDYI